MASAAPSPKQSAPPAAAYPESISTLAIVLHVEAAFQLIFDTRTDRRNWVCKSLSNRLSSFARGSLNRLVLSFCEQKLPRISRRKSVFGSLRFPLQGWSMKNRSQSAGYDKGL